MSSISTWYRASERPKLRRRLWNRFARRCNLCGRALRLRDVTIDHIVPVAVGGTNHVANLQPAHLSCNMRKGTNLMQ